MSKVAHMVFNKLADDTHAADVIRPWSHQLHIHRAITTNIAQFLSIYQSIPAQLHYTETRRPRTTTVQYSIQYVCYVCSSTDNKSYKSKLQKWLLRTVNINSL